MIEINVDIARDAHSQMRELWASIPKEDRYKLREWLRAALSAVEMLRDQQFISEQRELINQMRLESRKPKKRKDVEDEDILDF